MSERKSPLTFQKIKDAVRSFEWKSLAPVCLVIGILSLIAGLIVLFIRGGLGTDAAVYILLAIGIVGILSFGLLDPERIQIWLGSRQARYGVNILIMTVAMLGILVVVNYIVYQESEKRTLWVDLTEDKSNSLSPETVKTLQTMSQQVEARAYFTASNYEWDTTLTLLDKYKSQSGGKFTYQRIDPDASPVQAREDGITQDGTLVLATGDRTELVTSLYERQITTALIRLESGENQVYFLTGHGEAGASQLDNNGMDTVTSSLTRQSFKFSILDLRTQQSIPEDAKVLVMAGPKQPLLKSELTAIQDYLAKGGSLILLQNPYPLTEMTPETDILGEYLTKDWGVTLQNDVIFDSYSPIPIIPVGSISSTASSSTITENILYYLLFPTAESIVLTPDSANTLQQTALITIEGASPAVWGETNYSEIQSYNMEEGVTAAYNEGADIPAPLQVAVSVENPTTQARIVVFGDPDFASNQFVDAYSNRDLFINAIKWAARQEKLIELTPYETANRVILLPEQWISKAIMVVSAILLPGSFIVAGVIVWYNRRKHK